MPCRPSLAASALPQIRSNTQTWFPWWQLRRALSALTRCCPDHGRKGQGHKPRSQDVQPPAPLLQFLKLLKIRSNQSF